MRTARPRYAKAKPEGKRPTQNNGDETARLLLLVPLDVLGAFVVGTMGGNDHSEKNNGHRRMCWGNSVRNAIRRNDTRVAEWLAGFDNKAA
jgi:hypothetical protein